MATSKRNDNAQKPIWDAVKLYGQAEVCAPREIHAYLRHRVANCKYRDHGYRLSHTERDTGVKLVYESILHPTDPSQDILRVSLKYTKGGAL